MPKQKSHRGASKRFSLTKSGLAMPKMPPNNHLLTKNVTKRHRHRSTGDTSINNQDAATTCRIDTN